MKNRNLTTFIKAASVFRSGFIFLGVAVSTLLLTYSNQVYAQNPSTLIYDKDSLKADLLDLKETIYVSHENPFFYIDSLDFENEFEKTYTSVSEDISLADFSSRVGSLLQNLKDSHSTVSFRNLFHFLKADTALNFYFRTARIEDKLVITEDYLNILPKGAEILSINGIQADQLKLDLLPYMFLEGNSFEQSEVLVAGILPRLVAMKYGIKEFNDIEYIYQQKKETEFYPATPFKKIKKDKRNKPQNPYELEFIDSVAILRISSFSAKSEWYYERFLKKSFGKMKRQGALHLVIDLRNNLGGSVWRMEELFTYLDGPDVLTPKSVIMTQSELSNQKYYRLTKGISGWVRLHFLKKNDKMRVFRKMAALPLGARDTLIYKDYSEKKRLKFSGTHSLFINQASGSASVLFASSFDTNNFGTTFGSPCLGSYGGTWGDPTLYTLPRSKLQLGISVLKLSTSLTHSSDPKSISPDIPYKVTLDDIINNIDGLREFYLKHLNVGH